MKQLKYSALCAHFLRIHDQLTDEWQKSYLDACVSFLPHGTVMVGSDCIVEYINLKCKQDIPVGQRKPELIKSRVSQLNVTLQLTDTWRQFMRSEVQRQKTMQLKTKNEESTIKEIIRSLHDWFGDEWEGMRGKRKFGKLYADQAITVRPSERWEEEMETVQRHIDKLIRLINNIGKKPIVVDEVGSSEKGKGDPADSVEEDVEEEDEDEEEEVDVDDF